MANESSLIDHTNVVWWTTPLALLQLAFYMIGFISSTMFILIVVTRHELRQNLTLILASNLSIGGLISCASHISQTFYTLTSSENDELCPLRAYFFMTGIGVIFLAVTLQTVYRLFVVVLIHHRRMQNRSLFLYVILAQFLITLVLILPMLLGGHFRYLPDAKLCFMAFNDLFGVLYPACCFYFVPLTVQSLMSYRILRHISHETKAGREQINANRRAQKERRTLYRLVLPVILLISVGFIYLVFFFGTVFTGSSWQAPPYATSLSVVGMSAGLGLSMLFNVIINKQIWEIICSFLRCRMMRRRQNIIHVTAQQHLTIRQTTKV